MEITVKEIAEIFLIHGIKLDEKELTAIHRGINVSQADKIRRLNILNKLADEMLITFIHVEIEKENGSI